MTSKLKTVVGLRWLAISSRRSTERFRSHGGSLEAGNKPDGSGARFCFTLPMATRLDQLDA